ncbi:MAG: SGNH/GDSL hydrolase family protein [Elusimicrobiota bacterium]
MLKEKYPEPPGPGTERVMFIGSSQTWGEGAAKEEDTFVHLTEKILNRTFSGRKHVECINAGVRGSDSSRLFEYYNEKWVSYGHKLLIINLSSNLIDEDTFYTDITAFINLNRQKSIDTLLVLEANSPENGTGVLELHKVMIRAGKEEGVPVIDLHSYMRENHDKGIAWWDFVHMTSFGHRPAAEFFADYILKSAKN